MLLCCLRCLKLVTWDTDVFAVCVMSLFTQNHLLLNVTRLLTHTRLQHAARVNDVAACADSSIELLTSLVRASPQRLPELCSGDGERSFSVAA